METNTIHKGDGKGSENACLPNRPNWTAELERIPLNTGPPRSSKPEFQYIYKSFLKWLISF